MRVLGIDPGTLSSGYGIVDEEGGGLFFVCAGAITTSSKTEFPLRLQKIFQGYEAVIHEHKPDFVAVEGLIFAKNVQSALKLGHARGVALLAAVNLGLTVFEYSPLEIKQSVVGFGHAEKLQVSQMIKVLLKLDKMPKSLDASDALAVAICHIHSNRMREATGSRKRT